MGRFVSGHGFSHAESTLLRKRLQALPQAQRLKPAITAAWLGMTEVMP
jgi:hypothetical protein